MPHVLPLADLALFGVLSAIAGSLFRLLQMARWVHAVAALAQRDDGIRAPAAHCARAAVRHRHRGRGRRGDPRAHAADRTVVPGRQIPFAAQSRRRGTVQRRRQDRPRVREGGRDRARDAARARVRQRCGLDVRRTRVGGAVVAARGGSRASSTASASAGWHGPSCLSCSSSATCGCRPECPPRPRRS